MMMMMYACLSAVAWWQHPAMCSDVAIANVGQEYRSLHCLIPRCRLVRSSQRSSSSSSSSSSSNNNNDNNNNNKYQGIKKNKKKIIIIIIIAFIEIKSPRNSLQ